MSWKLSRILFLFTTCFMQAMKKISFILSYLQSQLTQRFKIRSRLLEDAFDQLSFLSEDLKGPAFAESLESLGGVVIFSRQNKRDGAKREATDRTAADCIWFGDKIIEEGSFFYGPTLFFLFIKSFINHHGEEEAVLQTLDSSENLNILSCTKKKKLGHTLCG
ncbi:hypothetical protein ACJX0J_014441, partial [Zea mays]